jgi:putative phage-type endonuclease
MKIVLLEQKSDEWLKWRREGVGASESAAVLGMGKYNTPKQIWEQKTERAFPPQINPDMQRGIDLEEEARHAFQFKHGHMFIPCCAEMDIHNIIRASFDGLRADNKEFVELKCPNPKSTKLWDVINTQDPKAVKEMYPDYYVQVQHQYAVCETAEKGYLAAYQNGKINSIYIPRDDDFIKGELMPSVGDFWNKYVKKDVEPPLMSKDFKYVDDEELKAKTYEWREVNKQLKSLKERESELKKEILEDVCESVIVGNIVKISRYSTTKTDYKKACEENGIETSKYTKTNDGLYRFTPINK